MVANVNVGGVYATFRAQNRQLLRATRENVRALRQTRSEFRKTATSVSAFRGVALRSVGAIGGIVGALQGVRQVLRTGLNIDTSFTQLQTLVGLSADEVVRLRKELIGVSAAEGLNLQELADGAFFLASAGVQVENISDVITNAGKAAALGLGPINKVAEALTTSLGAWGSAAEDAETETAILVATARLGRFPVEQFARQWSRVAGLAPSIGVTSREVSSLLSVLSRSLNLEQSATSLRTLLAQLNLPPKAAAKVFEQIGVSVDDIRKSIRERGLLQTLMQLENQLNAVGLELTDAFRSQEAATAIGILSTDNWSQALELAEEIAQVTGEDLNTAFEQLSQTASGQLRIALNKITTQFQRVAQIALPPLVKTLTIAVNNMDKLRYVAFLLGGILLRRLYFSKAAAAALLFAKGLLTASGAMAALTAATNFLRVALIRIGLGVLIVAIGEAIYQIIRFTNSVGGLRNAFTALIQIGEEVFNRFLFNFKLVILETQDIAINLRLIFARALLQITENTRENINRIIGYFFGGFAAIREIAFSLPEVFRTIFNDIINLASRAANGLVNKFREAINLIASFLDLDFRLEIEEVEVNPTQIGSTLSDVGKRAGNAFNNAVQETINTGPLTDGSLINNIDTLLSRQELLELEKEITRINESERRVSFKSIIDQFNQVGESAENAIEPIENLNKEINDFQIGDNVSENGVGGQVENVAEELSERVKNLQRLAGDVGQAFGDFAGQVITNFKNIGEAARELGRTIVDALIKRLISTPIANAITGGLTSLFGIPGLQTGGLGRGLTLVGEAGPELVDFRKPGRVYSNDELTRAIDKTSGNVFNFAPVINSSDSAAVNRALAEAYPLFENRVLSTIQLNARRPSGLRNSLRG